MCSAGGPMEIQIFDLEEREFECGGCGKRFRSTKENPACPECHSESVKAV